MDLQSISSDLRRTVDAAKGRLAALDAKTVTYRPAADRWTIAEVIGHLIDSAANNHQRFVRAQFVEELVFPKYEQNEWISAQYFNDCEWPSLVELWHRYPRDRARESRVPRPAMHHRPVSSRDPGVPD